MQKLLSFTGSFLLLFGFIGCSESSKSNEIIPNTAPVVLDQNLTLDEDTPLLITLSGSDSDGNAITYRIVRNPRHGQLQGPTTNLSYIPSANYNGNDNFTFVANDGRADSPTATIRLEIQALNDAPIANDITVNIENESSSIILTAQDSDGGTLTYTYSEPSHGLLSGTPPYLTYLPEEGYFGTDSFEYSANDGENDSNMATVSINILDDMVNVSGQVTYDFVPGSARGLEYTNTASKPARFVVVQVLNYQNEILHETYTDEDGNYLFANLQGYGKIKMRVLAKLLKTDALPFWDVKVVDNTNNDALYVMDGTLTDLGLTDNIRNLHASSGWDGSSYANNRTAAPFAILDSVYSAIAKVRSAQNDINFEPLVINWSVNNKTTDGDLSQGEIGSSFYTDAKIYILGDADGDTDEYDNHVIAHEWGHYYEDKFSRSDSIGGSHGGGDILDIRVAFGKGWGNAFSAIALDDPIYSDTSGPSQAAGFEMNIESDAPQDAGWFSESSIQRIIYDLYDSHDDAANSDTLSLGFAPIHAVMKNAEKTTPAFTSIFSFIKAMKDAESTTTDAIERIVSSENIATIHDVFGEGRTNKASEYPYSTLSVGGSETFSTYTSYGTYNKLGTRHFVRFTIANAGNYTIRVSQTGASDADPDLYLYLSQPFSNISVTQGEGSSETITRFLNSGDYLLDISEYNGINQANFTISIQ